MRIQWVGSSARRVLQSCNAALFICVFAVAQPAKCATYTSTILYMVTPPPGYTAAGAVFEAPGGQSVANAFKNNDTNLHASWFTAGGTPTALEPAGFTASSANDVAGINQVGWARGTSTGNNSHAFVWSGTAASAVDLNPTFSSVSEAEGISGTQVVGDVGTGFGDAVLWTSLSASNAVNINSSGFIGSEANATDGSHQVGFGFTSSGGTDALLWSGTAASAVDLSPAGYTISTAFGVFGSHQVGLASNGSTYEHAMLWSGTAASAVDLNPAGVTNSGATGTNGVQQVGTGDSNAYVWSGSAASAVDLNSFLPALGNWTSSAYSIDANGNVFGAAQGTYNNVNGEYVVEWSPAPEPGTAILLALGTMGILFQSRRQTRLALPRG
jgi:hypothetical protein